MNQLGRTGMKRLLPFAAGIAAGLAVCGTPSSRAQNAPLTPGPDGITALRTIASQSQCAAHNWTARGKAPRSYIEGVTLVFARAVCHPERADVQAVSASVNTSPDSDD